VPSWPGRELTEEQHVQNDIRTGGDGVRCWNAEAIGAYVAGINEREARLTRDNPDVVVKPGRISCYGCEVQDYGYGTRCTAALTRTYYLISGEIPPRPADAAGSLLEIPGLKTLKPDSGLLSS
jgi:hypothetical protein